MMQAALAYLITALAAAWVVWSVLLPKAAKRAIRSRLGRRKAAAAGPKGGCGDDCGCGD